MRAPVEILNAIRLQSKWQQIQQANAEKLWRDFGEAVRAERKRRKLTLKFFAAQLRYTTAMVSFMESGRRTWPLKKAERAVSILNRGEKWPGC